MTNFFEIARPLAERGLRCFPLIPKTKRPLPLSGGDHFDHASCDLEQLEQWSQQKSEANVGISPDEYNCMVETDDAEAFLAACADLPQEIFTNTTWVSARENRGYWIFGQTMRTRKAGNMTVAREGKENLFEFKQFRTYVVGPGSIHPKTGGPYVAEWKSRPAMPDVLLNRLCELAGAPGTTATHPMDAETARQTALLDRFLEMFEVATDGDWFNKGNQWLLSVACPWKSEHDNSNEGTSACIFYNEGGGYGFKCRHRCEGKGRGWKEFRASVQSVFPDRRFSFVSSEGTVVMGKSAVTSIPTQPEEAPAPEHKRPVYPISIFDGTAAGEFARLCGEDNNVPRKFYVESFLCCLGAIVGDRLSCPVDGAIPRSFTILIAPKGKGKGTSVSRAERCFTETWTSAITTVAPGLIHGNVDSLWKPKGIGAYHATASSGPGMAKLTLDPKGTPSQFTWGGTIPRIISIHEELKTFLSALLIQGGTGSNLDGIICSLWDRVGFAAPGTGSRPAVYGQMQFSLLGAVTEEDWFNILSRSDVVGGGLMSRLNLIGTEVGMENVYKMRRPEFAALQQSFFPRIVTLADRDCRIPPSEGADQVVKEWTESLPEGTVRMNLHVWRNALRLAWLRQEEIISEKTAADAVLLGNYQLASHEFYLTQPVDNPYAAVQAKILRSLKMQGPASKRELQRRTNASRVGTTIWAGGLEGLIRDQALGKRDDGTYYLAAEAR